MLPAVTGAALTVLTTVTSAPGGPTAGGAPAGLVLLAGTGSVVAAVTVALLRTSVPLPVYAGASRTTMSTDSVAPTARDAAVGQVTFWPTAVHPATDDTKVVCAGSGSVITTLVANDGPPLVTCTV